MTDEKASHPPTAPRSFAAVAACIVAAGLLIAVDLGSKDWASEHLSSARFGNNAPACQADASGYIASVRVSMPPKVVVENFFELRYAENCGAAFGFLNSTNSPLKKVLFYGAAIGAVAVLLLSFRQGRGGKLFILAVPTIIAGALGNFSDRVRLGYVVDFFRFYYRAWEYPTFNVADIAITVGVIALVFDGIAEELHERRVARAERSSGMRLAGSAAESRDVEPAAAADPEAMDDNAAQSPALDAAASESAEN